MEKNRQRAYRILLYHAMLDIRLIKYPPHRIEKLNPFAWRRYFQNILLSGCLADWLHNVAEFSTKEFEDFNEGFFWNDFELLRNHYPALAKYQIVFESELSRDLQG